MSRPRDIRSCALQALYQFDAAGVRDDAVVRESLAGSPGGEAVHDAGFDLAQAVWDHHTEADRTITVLTPQWPTHRQSVIDRNILRLGYYEIMHGDTPPKVAINEAVELAKEFSSERSPAFINGVLDKIYRQSRAEQPAAGDAADQVESDPAEHATVSPASDPAAPGELDPEPQ